MCYSPHSLAKGRFEPSKRAAGSLAGGRLSPSNRAAWLVLDHSAGLDAWDSTQMVMIDPTQAARLLVNRASPVH
jgi:hypothetical protein